MKKKMAFLLVLFMLMSGFSGCQSKKDGLSKGSLDADTKKTQETQEKKNSDKASLGKEDAKSDQKQISQKSVNKVSKDDIKEKEAEVLKIYSPLLDEYHKIVSNYSEDFAQDYEVDDDKIGVFEYLWTNSSDNPVLFGYCLEDFNKDGVLELVISTPKKQENGEYKSEDILALYTISDDEVKPVIIGSSRDSHCYLGDGKFYNLRSLGGLYYANGVYKLSKDAQKMEYIDFYFSDEKELSSGIITYYHNNTGVMDKSVSEELNISEDEFWKIDEKFLKQAKPLKFTLFSDYEEGQYSGLPLSIANSKKEELDYVYDYDSFRAEDKKYPVKATLQAKKDYTDLKILELEYVGQDKKDNPKFSTKVVYEAGEFPSARPFILGMKFLGSIPNNGISFVDENGKTRYFMIYESSKDGSLLLSEF